MHSGASESLHTHPKFLVGFEGCRSSQTSAQINRQFKKTGESITSQVFKLGKKIHFGAETCGVQICDERTWLRGASTVRIGFAYVLSADEACQRGTGPFLSGWK